MEDAAADDRRSERARILAPPPLIAAACLGAALLLERWRPLPFVPELPELPLARLWLSLPLFVVASLVFFFALRALFAHHTSPDPYRPTAALVASGPYRRTRNPLYVGLLLVQLGLAVAVGSLWVLASVVPLFLLLHYGVVRAEERYLAARFGAAYEEYRRRVRRWL